MSLVEAYSAVRSEIARSCARAGRDPHSVSLLAATKQVEPERILALQRLVKERGETILFGENYLQEIATKKEIWSHCPLHFIGRLQSNKIADLIKLGVKSIQSVISAKQIALVNAACEKQKKRCGVYLQVNISADPAKAGISLDQVAGLVAEVEKFPETLKLEGVMTILAEGLSTEEIRLAYRALHQFRQAWPKPLALSMGMSQDFSIAIEEGADLIRVGSALFGARTV